MSYIQQKHTTDISLVSKKTLTIAGMLIFLNITLLAVFSLYSYYQKNTQFLETLLRQYTHIAYEHMVDIVHLNELKIYSIHNTFYSDIDYNELEKIQKSYRENYKYPDTLFFVYRSKTPSTTSTYIGDYKLVFNGIEKDMVETPSPESLPRITSQLFSHKLYILDDRDGFSTLLQEYKESNDKIYKKFHYVAEKKSWYMITVSKHTYKDTKTGNVYTEYLISISSVFDRKMIEEISQYKSTNKYGNIVIYVVVMNEDGSFSYHFISGIKEYILEENPNIIKAIKESRDIYRYSLMGRSKSLYSVPFDPIKVYIVGVLVRDSVLLDFFYDIVPIIALNLVSQCFTIFMILKYLYNNKSRLKQIITDTNTLLCACDGECFKMAKQYRDEIQEVINSIRALQNNEQYPINFILAKLYQILSKLRV